MKLIKSAVRSLLLVEDKPQRTALAFAVGVFWGFSPFLGLHMVLGLLVAFTFRLNKIAVLIGAFLNTPWLAVPFYSFATWLGVQLLGLPEGIFLPEVGLLDLFEREFWVWLVSQWRLLIPAFVGSMVLCTALAVGSYFLALHVLREWRGADN